MPTASKSYRKRFAYVSSVAGSSEVRSKLFSLANQNDIEPEQVATTVLAT